MKRVLTSIWFLALFVSVPLALLLPQMFNRYEARLKSVDEKLSAESICYYRDLNSDGIQERIECFVSHGYIFSFQVFNKDNEIWDQYNYPYEFNSRLQKLSFFDADKDGLEEVYGFTVFHDSLFLNWIEPMDEDPEYSTRYIATINTELRKSLDVSVTQLIFHDLDGDGSVEIVFSPSVGFNYFPRKLFAYHPETDRLENTDDFGSHFLHIAPFDLHMDGSTELLCISSSSWNIAGKDIDIRYPDDRPRLFVFDSKLQMVTDPVEFPVALGAYVEPHIMSPEEGDLVLLYHSYSSMNTGAGIGRLNLQEGKVSDTLRIYNLDMRKKLTFIKDGSSFLLIDKRGKIYKIDKELAITDSIDLEFISDHFLAAATDFFSDGSAEYVFYENKGHKLILCFSNFRHQVELEFNSDLHPNCFLLKDVDNEFVVDVDGKLHYYEISKNSFYWLKYPSYLIVYFISVLFIWVLQYARMKQLREKYELRDKVHELQLSTLKNQLDPHFVNNSFNTVASVIKQARIDEAYDLFVTLSRMIRYHMQGSTEIYTTLTKEIKFVEEYLYIQKFRFPQVFDYHVVMNNTIPDIKFPKMLVQIHVENALKHGLRNGTKRGMLLVKVNKEKSGLKIVVEDDGIGRERSAVINKGKVGIGYKTARQIIELNNRKGVNKITQEVMDLKDSEGSPAGIRVIIGISK